MTERPLNAARALDDFEEAYRAKGAHAAGEVLARVLQAANSADANRDLVYAEAVRRTNHDDVGLGAHYALCAGALIENGAAPGPLAAALAVPLSRALESALVALTSARALPDIGDVDDDTAAFYAGDQRIDAAQRDALEQANPGALAALESLDTWYRPVACAWTRDLGALAAAQRDATLCARVDAAGNALPFVRALLRTSLGAPFVVLVPELETGFALSLHGVCDTGQLTVLLSVPLADALARVHASGPADDAVLAAMRGDDGAPQEQGGTYGATFHLYPWQAFDPARGLPADKRFMWSAPGGTGWHSLPGDFLPGDITPLTRPVESPSSSAAAPSSSSSLDARVLFLVGPRAENTAGFMRVIPATRLFSALRARIDDVRELSRDEVVSWTRAVREALP